MQIQFKYYPGGKRKALTMSYDDGPVHDRRLVSIFNQYGVKGTFHLNSGLFGQQGRIDAAEVQSLYDGHEISAHGLSHPFLSLLPRDELVHQMQEDRRRLEELAQYPVRGMSYPFGDVNDEVLSALPALGVEYSRTVQSTGQFQLPNRFLLWHPTCHHNDRLMERLQEFRHTPSWRQMPLFYVWGHSYEFPNDDNWSLIEEFCRAVANDPDVWYATNIEVVDYVTALRGLKFTVDRSVACNPSARSVWIDVDGRPVEIQPGERKRLSAT